MTLFWSAEYSANSMVERDCGVHRIIPSQVLFGELRKERATDIAYDDDLRNQIMRIDKEKIVYRRATTSDVQALVDYRVQFLNEHFDHAEDDATGVLRMSLSEYFAKAIPSKEHIAWVAEYQGKIIATSGMVVWQKPALYGGVESGRLGYLLNFYTASEARRKGIGTRLLNELIKEARSLGLKYLHLHASKDGIGIYRRAGFSEPGEPELELRLEKNSRLSSQQ